MKRILAAGMVAFLALGADAYAQGPRSGSQPMRGAFGPGLGRGMMQGGLGLWFGPNGASLVQVLMKLTEQQPADVFASLRSGMTFAQIAEAAGRSRQELIDAVLAERRPIVDQAVASGYLTQAQADQLMSWMRPHVETTVDGAWAAGSAFGFGPGRGFGRGVGFGRGAGFGPGMYPWVTNPAATGQ